MPAKVQFLYGSQVTTADCFSPNLGYGSLSCCSASVNMTERNASKGLLRRDNSFVLQGLATLLRENRNQRAVVHAATNSLR